MGGEGGLGLVHFVHGEVEEEGREEREKEE